MQGVECVDNILFGTLLSSALATQPGSCISLTIRRYRAIARVTRLRQLATEC